MLQVNTNYLNFRKTTFMYVNVWRKIPQGIHLILLGNKDIYCIVKTCCVILLHFPQNAVYSVILSFYIQVVLMFFINHAPKFKYPHQ
jgi:hypothetical protein